MTDSQDHPEWLEQEVTFMQQVISACKTPEGMANLRTGNRPGGLDSPWRMMPHLVRVLPKYQEEKKIFLQVAAWYAGQVENPRTRQGKKLPPAWTYDQGNFGWSMAQSVAKKQIQQKYAVEKLELITRIRHNPDIMRRELGPLVQKLAKARTPISWPILLRDLNHWRSWPIDVTSRWMNAYYDPDYNIVKAPTETQK